MTLKFNIKPNKIEASRKVSIIMKLSLYGWHLSSLYGSYYKETENDIIVINYNKINKKTKQIKKIVNGKSKTTSKIIREAKWIAYYYYIPKAWLIATNNVVEQRSRNFIIKPKR